MVVWLFPVNTVNVLIVCQAERSRVFLLPQSLEHCVASLVQLPQKHKGGREGWGEDLRGGVTEEEELLEKVLLTGSGEGWMAEVFAPPQTPPPPLWACAPLSAHCHSRLFTPFPP